MKQAKAPSIFVSLLFLVGAIIGYSYLGADETGALITSALAFATAIWKFVESQREPVEIAEREINRSRASRLFWG